MVLAMFGLLALWIVAAVVAMLSHADWENVRTCHTTKINLTSSAEPWLEADSWLFNLSTAVEAEIDYFMDYRQPGDVLYSDLEPRFVASHHTDSMHCTRLAVSLLMWWLVTIHRDALGLGLTYCVGVWSWHAMGQAAAHEKQAVDAVMDARTPGGRSDASRGRHSPRRPRHSSRERRGWRGSSRAGPADTLQIVDSVNDVDVGDPHHHLLALGVELGGPLPAAFGAALLLVISELLWPSLASTAACFVVGQPLILCLLIAPGLAPGLAEFPKPIAAAHITRWAPVGMILAFVILPALQSWLFGEAGPVLASTVVVDWSVIITPIALLFYGLNEETVPWTGGILWLACGCRRHFGVRSCTTSWVLTNRGKLWWGLFVTPIAALYTGATIAAVFSPLLLCEVAMAGFLARVLLKTRNNLPRWTRTPLKMVNCVNGILFPAGEAGATDIESIASDKDAADTFVVALIVGAFGLAAFLLLAAESVGSPLLRDTNRSTLLPLTSILMSGNAAGGSNLLA